MAEHGRQAVLQPEQDETQTAGGWEIWYEFHCVAEHTIRFGLYVRACGRITHL